jgi:hypothetical protein
MAQRSSVLKRFASSPEARALDGGAGWSATVAAFARLRLGRDITALTAPALEQILFRFFPEEVVCSPAEASAIVVELRAFFRFVSREEGSKSAEACLRVLDASAARRLRRTFADPANFGTAKLFLHHAGPIAP